jgi:hypothetical protein
LRKFMFLTAAAGVGRIDHRRTFNNWVTLTRASDSARKPRCQMSLRGVIRKPDRTALGTAADVQLQLSRVFSGVRFDYLAEEPPAAIEARKQMSLALRLTLLLFGVDGRYPCCNGSWQRAENLGGGAIEFYFETNGPVRYVSATGYGRTGGFDALYEELEKSTGWKINYGFFA